jgi:hypothetical protein
VTADAIGAWSGVMEFDQHDQGTAWPCYMDHTNEPNLCKQDVQQYLDCGSLAQYPNAACGNPPQYGRYIEAGPITSYIDETSLPKSFFANGGGPYWGPNGQPDPEGISLQSMVDPGA